MMMMMIVRDDAPPQKVVSLSGRSECDLKKMMMIKERKREKDKEER